MTSDATLTRLREYAVGPTRFMDLLSCFELGIVDTLRENPGMTAAKLGASAGVKPDAVEQLLHLLVKDEFVAYDKATGGYTLDSLADVDEAGLHRVLAFMKMIKVCVLRQVFYLTESVRTGKVVGLKELYDFDGNLYDALAEHSDLRESWSTLMDTETAHHDPWFFGNVDIPDGARVLDLAGNTGLGAILTYQLKHSPGLRVTTFDLPHKEEACLENFRAHGVSEHCSFIGGDVFVKVPEGFDVVLVKHFLAMFDKEDVLKIFRRREGQPPGADLPGEPAGVRRPHRRLLPDLLPRLHHGQGWAAEAVDVPELAGGVRVHGHEGGRRGSGRRAAGPPFRAGHRVRDQDRMSRWHTG
jgi:hypothetical protein